jgi:hypothetical protein
MIALESGAPIPAPAIYPDVVVMADAEGQVLLGSGDTPLPAETGGNSLLSDDNGSIGDEWIAQMLSTASSDTIATLLILPRGDVLLDPQSYDGEDVEDIVITGKRLTYDYGGSTGGAGGYTGGYTGYTGGGTDGGGGGTGPTATPAEQHTQDCGSEDGAAVQIAKHVTGELPAGVAGPPDRVTTSAGNDWTQVEFGAVIIRNSNGTFGALNDMIYSSNQQTYAAVPSGVGQPVQGLWHSHPTRGGDSQQAIDRYPSLDDWASLARVASQAGAAANPSLWIMGPDGVTREFSLSERSYFESLSTDTDTSRMVKGEGLDGKERTQSCS